MKKTNKSRNDIGFYVNPKHADLERHFSWLHDHGIRCIGGPCHPETDEVLRRMDRLMEKYEMRMASLHHGAPQLLSPDGDDDRLRPGYAMLFERAKRWNAGAVVIHFRSLEQPWRDGIWWAETDYITRIGVKEYDRRQGRMLKWICGKIAKSNTVIALENLPQRWPYSYDAAEIAETVRGYKIPNLGVCFDSGHANLGDINPVQAVSSLGKTLVTTHLHDNFGWTGPRSSHLATDLHLVPGLGTIDWRAMLLAFRKIGYKGPYIFEGPNLPGETEEEKIWGLTLQNWAAFETLADKAAESS